MDVLIALWQGILIALEPINLGLAVVGVVVGLFVGGKQAPWAYYMQRAVVGAPGMSEKAQAYFTDLFTKVYNSKKWQAYKSKKSLMGEFMAGDELKAYWTRQVDNHRAILKASGAIK